MLWLIIIPHVPKSNRYTIGSRIENKFLDLLELAYTTYFIEKDKKADKLGACIFTLDILKFLISVAWETKLVSHKHYRDIALELDEIGKMFWGWKKSLDQPHKQSLRSSDLKKNRA